MLKGSFLFMYAKQALVWFGLNKSHIYRQKAVHMCTFPEHTHLLWVVIRAPLFVPPHSYIRIRILTPKVVVVGAGASGRIPGPEGGTLRAGVSALTRDTPEIWLRPSNLGGHSGSQAGCAGRRAAWELSPRPRCSDIQNPQAGPSEATQSGVLFSGPDGAGAQSILDHKPSLGQTRVVFWASRFALSGSSRAQTVPVGFESSLT